VICAFVAITSSSCGAGTRGADEPAPTIERAEALVERAKALAENGDADGALELFAKSEKILLKLSDNPALAKLYVGMARVMFDAKRPEGAKFYCYKVIEEFEQDVSGAAVSAAQALIWLGNIASNKDKFEEALGQYQRAVEAVRRSPGEHAELAAEALMSVGMTLNDQCKHLEALEYHNEAIVEYASGDHDNELLAELHGRRANVFEEMCRYEEAIADLNRAREAYLAMRRMEEADVLWTDLQIAECLVELGRTEEALELAEATIGQISPTTKEREKLELSLRLVLVLAHYASGHYEEAISLGYEVSCDADKQLGKRSYHAIAALARLGHAYSQLERHEQARSVYKEALRRIGRRYGTDHRFYAGALYNLGVSFLRDDRPTRAIDYLEEARSIVAEPDGPIEEWRQILIDFQIGNAMVASGEDIDGLQKMARSLERLEGLTAYRFCDWMGWAPRDYAVLLCKHSQQEQGREYLERAKTFVNEHYPSAKRSLAKIEKAIAECTAEPSE